MKINDKRTVKFSLHVFTLIQKNHTLDKLKIRCKEDLKLFSEAKIPLFTKYLMNVMMSKVLFRKCKFK